MIAAIIQARMGSTRLPGKVIKPLCGKPVLWHVVTRVMEAKTIDTVIVATTEKKEDDAIVDLCHEYKFPVLRGSENDVLDRYYQCASTFHADVIVRITSDCPLIDPCVVDLVVRDYLIGNFDYVTNTLEYTFPDGLDVEVFSFEALKTAWQHATLSSEREHVTPYIRNHGEFRKKNVTAKNPYPSYRLTLDFPEDYQLIKQIYEGLGCTRFYLDDINAYLKANPDLTLLNQRYTSNEGYLISLVEDAKKTGIVGERIILKSLSDDDATPEYCGWLNDPEINKFLVTKDTTIDQLKEYIRSKRENKSSLFFGIFLKENRKHIGNIKLDPINYSEKEATIGILIGDRDSWSRGYCTEAVTLVKKYMFTKKIVNTIRLGVIAGNIPAVHCYQKSGFLIEKPDTPAKTNADDFEQILIMSTVRHEQSDLIQENTVNYDAA
jgi:spore coat polysaccharide biosynthesis protein SpsF